MTKCMQTLRANMKMIRDLAYEKEVEKKVKQKSITMTSKKRTEHLLWEILHWYLGRP